ncbi:MAG: hypothetical protein V1487_04570 [bacterium]
MRKIFAIFFGLMVYWFNGVISPSPTLALEPTPPFSRIGNPTDEYQLESFFPLLRFIKPSALIVYENQDENRTYQAKPPNTPTPSGSPSTKTPVISIDPKGTDFSRNENLAYPKFQNEALRYENPGSDNTLTWGSHFLTLSRCDRAARQLMVAYQAAQTQQTVDQTEEWPLGWVDWGYVTRYQTKTLGEVWDLLASAGLTPIAQELVSAQDSFFQSLGTNTPTPPHTPTTQSKLCTLIGSTAPQAPWLEALELLPLYPPSFRQGYVRTSICVWNICLPSKTSNDGQGLYADTSISSAYAASVYDLLQNFPLSQALDQLNNLAKTNPLIRFSMTSNVSATPSHIFGKLRSERINPNLPQDKLFTFSWLGSIFDYQKEMDKYGYQLAPTQSKEEGGAFNASLTSKIINFVYGVVDSAAPVTNHLLTIPEPLGQAIFQIQQPVYNSRDSTSELKGKYTETLSNVVDGSSILLYAGKGLAAGDARRRLAYFTCRDPEYSSPKEIDNIKAYALGTRIGCYEETAPAGKCDGTAFAKFITNSPYTTPTSSADSLFASLQAQLTPDLINIYGAAAAVTGVPCEVMAGMHYVEADLDPQGSLISGRKLGEPEPEAGGRIFKTLLETAVYAGNELKGKVNGNLTDIRSLIAALSRKNGGGNSNCQAGYPYPIPYTGCPRLFEGEDDIYPMNWIDDKHSTMYLLYCADLTACEPKVWERMGSLTFAVEMYNNITSQETAQ